MSGSKQTPGSPETHPTSPADASPNDTASRDAETAPTLYFFPDRDVTVDELRQVLAEGPEERRAWAISHLLRYAQWDDIWVYVSREEVREIFPALDLPENLRNAWGRMLKVEAPVA